MIKCLQAETVLNKSCYKKLSKVLQKHSTGNKDCGITWNKTNEWYRYGTVYGRSNAV